MKLLNVGCGGHRPPEPWTNLDTLRRSLKEGSPERTNLDAELNYVECDLLLQSIPFRDEWFDGILLQHVLEHFSCHETTEVLYKCRAVLKKGGVLVASVPNVDYFEMVHTGDTKENAVQIFGESISGDWQDSQCNSFFDYALFHRQHKQILNQSGLWALLRRSGFEHGHICDDARNKVADEVAKQLNRLKFSAILYAYK
jgi:ubiquinone/menaquinone biosynthesis C-methylase UbiE